MCDKTKCERAASDCDVQIYLKNKNDAESEVSADALLGET
jgi:hypothetical protein